jgi:tRNA dimethylallyltransferase
MQVTSTHPTETRADARLPPVILLMGPTASGKTSLAIALAKALNGEIISVDSALVFRGMDIGTAKPDLDERAGIPHHLIDILDPAERYSTGQFQKDATAHIEDMHGRGLTPILAGGTMLYFHGLLHGIAPLPPADPVFRAHLENEAENRGWGHLHAKLKALDPVAADRIHPNDPQRIQRALEIHHLTGRPMTAIIEDNPPPARNFRMIPILLTPSDRERLGKRIEDRFTGMIEKGLIEEVAALRERGDLHPELPSMRAVGYRQVWDHLEGRTSRGEMIERGVIATRQFAKRQQTWLKKESFAVNLSSEDPHLADTALQKIGPLLD